MNNGAFQSLIGHGTPKRGGEKRGKSALPCSDGPSKDNLTARNVAQCSALDVAFVSDLQMTCQQ